MRRNLVCSVGVLLVTLIIMPCHGYCQEMPVAAEQQMEHLAGANEETPDDDFYSQQMESLRKNPLNLNGADEGGLKELHILNDMQIQSLIAYRKLLGDLISIFELQAIPGWDLLTIRKVLPYVTTGKPDDANEKVGVLLRNGQHSLMIRLSQVMEKATKADPTPAEKFAGGPQRVFFRYEYKYKNLFQFGITGDKDAGEQFLKGAQRMGFDFYSFHLFLKRPGPLRILALGDFTINFGQGLVHWQGLAFKKSAEVIAIKRQANAIRAYHSPGEYNFHRGAAITLRKRSIELSAFVSFRKLSANTGIDTSNGQLVISSFNTSGYHRTVSEIEDRNRVRQIAAGGKIMAIFKRGYCAVNSVYHLFSLPIHKKDEPYNLYSINDDWWYNTSIDYAFTVKNFHFFGEAAIDKKLNTAFISGVLLSADARLDLSLLQRTISPAYQAIAGNAFTENTMPGNETGFYIGMCVRPVQGLRIDGYADVFRFPWLRYLADAPSGGIDLMMQFNYTPSKQVEFYSRFRNETKESNEPGNTSVTNYLVRVLRKSWRTHLNFQVNKSLLMRSRVDCVWYNQGLISETGFLIYADVVYKPFRSYSGILRLQFFETNGNNSRLYAYESDVMFSNSIPSFSDKGMRYYLLVDYQFKNSIRLWARWGQTLYSKGFQRTGVDAQSKMFSKTEVKFQFQFLF